MLILLVIAAACHVTTAGAFLDDCPIDREHRLGDVLVLDVLESFYKDLIFVQACTELQQSLEYEALLREMKQSHTTPLDGANGPADQYSFVTYLLRLLATNHLFAVNKLINETWGSGRIRGWISTYFQYIDAEVKSSLGEYDEALEAIIYAFGRRRKFRGVSMNRLERFDGLLALQKVSEFNRDIDSLYGLKRNRDHQLLSLVHLIMKEELEPLNKIRNSLDASSSAPTTGSNHSNAETHDEQGADANFIGNGISKAQVESILCEFAEKFGVLGAEETSIPHYREVMDQVRLLDANLAQELEVKVMQYIDIDINSAKIAMADVWREYGGLENQNETGKIFLFYLLIELDYLQSEHGCSINKLGAMQRFYSVIVRERREHRGISIGMLTQLGAKMVLHWLKCFHERVKVAYELDGSEDEQQLEAKRSVLGTSLERTLPASDLFLWYQHHE